MAQAQHHPGGGPPYARPHAQGRGRPAVTDLCEAYPLKVFADAVGILAEGREKYLLPYGDMVFNAFGPVNERFNACLQKVKGRVVFEGTGSQLRAQPEMLNEHLGV